MTPFTNNDLKILKAWTEIVDTLAFDALPQGKLWALLARLEAAERVCRACTRLNEGEFDDAIEAWRKAAGK